MDKGYFSQRAVMVECYLHMASMRLKWFLLCSLYRQMYCFQVFERIFSIFNHSLVRFRQQNYLVMFGQCLICKSWGCETSSVCRWLQCGEIELGLLSVRSLNQLDLKTSTKCSVCLSYRSPSIRCPLTYGVYSDHMPKYLETKKRKPHKALIILQASLRDMTTPSISF